MLTSAVISLLLFSFLWKNVGNAWDFLCSYPALSWDKQGLIETLKETAKYYDVPESEKDKEGAAKIAPFFDAKDEYTGCISTKPMVTACTGQAGTRKSWMRLYLEV